MIDHIYEAARTRGLVRSRRQFSQEFLGRAPNYACDTGLSRCSAGVLLNLYRALAGHPDLQALAFEHLLAAEAWEGDARAVRP